MVDCFTSGGVSAAPFSPLWETGFLFFAPVTRLTRTCVNTLLWSNSVFLHQSSSFLTEVVFDIESCIQKAHWYCEQITVHVINSFIFYFLSVFDVTFVGTKIHCIACRTIFFSAQTYLVWLPCSQYLYPVYCFYFNFLFFLGHLSFVIEVLIKASWKKRNPSSEYCNEWMYI